MAEGRQRLMDIGRLGVWTRNLDHLPAASAADAARQIERFGFSAIWFPEATRREAVANAALLLQATSRITIATGIANAYARDASAMAAAQLTLAEAYPGRFLLGLGVSHRPRVTARGHAYLPPVEKMRRYLDELDAAPYDAPRPAVKPPRVLAALAPAMLRLAAERSDGAHPYFVPVEHTRRARQILGPDRLLAPEVAVVLPAPGTDMRSTARHHVAWYLRIENYARNLARLGYSAEELQGEGSERLIDDIVACGWQEAEARIREHLSAGSDHVAVHVITDDESRPPFAEWERLAALRLEPT